MRPKRIRSTLVALMFSGYAIGGMTSALLGAWLVPAIWLENHVSTSQLFHWWFYRSFGNFCLSHLCT